MGRTSLSSGLPLFNTAQPGCSSVLKYLDDDGSDGHNITIIYDNLPLSNCSVYFPQTLRSKQEDISPFVDNEAVTPRDE